MADQENTQESTSTIIYLWKIPIDKTYVTSLIGILKVAAAVLSLIAFICVASGRSDNCDDDYSSTYNYFEFVSISAFFTLIILWLIHTITLSSRLFFKLVPWTFVDLIYCGVYIILYVIANIVLAAQSCGKDSNKAGAAFGFFALFCYGGNAFFAFQSWRSSRNRPPADTTASKSPDYNAERNMELY
ncbi:cklf-like marvel transmembrane domain-containing protein 4 [Plakobranchus ocellatus]|uniref:Cklf-like marvel transmembrane domain-containing protein 4 n=1 Tax=Plakobranchus ocellatus TaxID=259542 RepID=A0AAV4AHJ7_9GAST|nr:cklf-like marvel transmembrane domain-containing protein 4 [Plakobranchus ocellatus]